MVREKRGQAEEGLRIATLAEVDGFLEGLLSLGRLSQAHVGQAHLVVGLVVRGELSHGTLEVDQAPGRILLRHALHSHSEGIVSLGREAQLPHGNGVAELARALRVGLLQVQQQAPSGTQVELHGLLHWLVALLLDEEKIGS